MDFERLLAEHRTAAERYVRFRLSSRSDADDVLQELQHQNKAYLEQILNMQKEILNELKRLK